MAVMPRATSRQEYEQWFKEADKNNDGFLTAKELKKMFKSKGYKTSSKVFKQQFASLDADSDNKVTLEEYLRAMGELKEDQIKAMRDSSGSDSDDDVTDGKPASPADFEKWFKEADKNNDGFLTANELKKMFKAKGYKYSSKAFKQQFANLDIDGDKKITLQEYLKAMGQIPEAEHKQSGGQEVTEQESRQRHENWFREADTNNDGYITSKELKKMLKTKGVKLSGKAMKSYFATMDSDKDKKITFGEYMKAMGYPDVSEPTTAMPGSPSVSQSDPLAPFRPDGVSVIPQIQHLKESEKPKVEETNLHATTHADAKQIPPIPESQQILQYEESKQKTQTNLESHQTPPTSESQQIPQTPESKQATPADISQPIPETAKPGQTSTVAESRNIPPSSDSQPIPQKAEPVQIPEGSDSKKAAEPKQNPQTQEAKHAIATQTSESIQTTSESQVSKQTESISVVREAEIRALFEKADKNGDGFLDMEEMKVILKETHTGLTNKQLFDIMHKADTDKSGVINYNEFMVLWLKERGILKD